MKVVGFSGSPRQDANIGLFRPYMENTRQVFGFMGFKPKEIIVAGGTREKADVDKQKDLMAKAKEAGAGLVK